MAYDKKLSLVLLIFAMICSVSLRSVEAHPCYCNCFKLCMSLDPRDVSPPICSNLCSSYCIRKGFPGKPDHGDKYCGIKVHSGHKEDRPSGRESLFNRHQKKKININNVA
ncbi:hypothetical protein KFK09_024701 [Dendrobium nobile]|uniref:Uncharacterized protein n=1 Tax=Dendrobium nobile TaxID=94219 RepID=A0A8T3AEQ6_DENNO|nr:hypothetical protein KFK09_024701 [Dendrobium nobile]